MVRVQITRSHEQTVGRPKLKEKNMDNEIWEAAEFSVEWDGVDSIEENIRYKLFEVPRGAIDEESEEKEAHLLIGIETGGVRRVEVLMDTAYGREIDMATKEILEIALKNAPEEAIKLINSYD